MINTQNIIPLKDDEYYLLINAQTKKALSIPITMNPSKQKMILQEPDENNIRQVWMIVQMQPKKWEIVHFLSALVIEQYGKQCILSQGKWRSSQFFYPSRLNNNKQFNSFWLRQNQTSVKRIVFENQLCCKQVHKDDRRGQWILQLVRHNDIINNSCTIQYPFSNQCLDVPEGSQKPGIYITQYKPNLRVNQRWIFIKDRNKQHYLIKSLKSNLYLDIKGGSSSQGTNIIQWNDNDGQNQRWKVEYYGKGLYYIKSVMDNSLYLSINGCSTKQSANVIISKKQEQSLWKINGHIQV